MKRKRGVLITVLLAVCLLLLTGCKANKEDVRLASVPEIRLYALLHYGLASCYEVSEEQYSRTVTFTDRQYGFTYTVKSEVISEIFGYYEKTSSHDFNRNYYHVLAAKAAKKFNPQYDVSDGSLTERGYEFRVYHVGAEEAENITSEIGKYLKKLDTRNFYKYSESCVEAYQEEGKGYHGYGYLGAWHLSDGKYYSYADENIEQMRIHVNSDINRPGWEEKEIQFLYWEQMKLSEVPGLENWELVNEELDDDTIVTLYWFDIGGEKHFYADVEVWNVSNEYYSDILEERKKQK